MRSSSFRIVALLVPLTLDSLLVASTMAADNPAPTPLATVKWEKLKEAGVLKTGEVIPGKEGEPSRLKIINEGPGTKTLLLCELDSPPIKTPSYAIRGKIRYDNVVGVGFLEMLNHFAGDQTYFSRNLDTDGPGRTVTGSSAEREFELPFHTGGQSPAPKKLTLNLILNGPGTVEIGPLELVAIEAMLFDGDSTAWWTGPTAGLIGGIGGSIIGVLGGVIGTLISLGKGKNFVVSLALCMAVSGVVVVVTGIVAVINHQPFTVYYAMLLMGGMMTFFGCMILGIAPGRYRTHELRRMQALDV